MNWEQFAAAGDALGHSEMWLEERGNRYRGFCSCGYQSTNRRTQVDAIGALSHHIKKAVLAAHANGVSPQKSPAPAKVDSVEGTLSTAR